MNLIRMDAAMDEAKFCMTCAGLGWIEPYDPEIGVTQDCPRCDGSGESEDDE